MLRLLTAIGAFRSLFTFTTTGSDTRPSTDSLNVLGLPALRAFGYIELHRLTFLQAAKSASLNGGEMHEDILTILTADEAIAFGVVKPLYCSLFH